MACAAAAAAARLGGWLGVGCGLFVFVFLFEQQHDVRPEHARDCATAACAAGG